jgi:hypothetical protein
MTTRPRNLAFPLFLLAIFAFLLLLFLGIWFSGGSHPEPETPGQAAEAIREKSAQPSARRAERDADRIGEPGTESAELESHVPPAIAETPAVEDVRSSPMPRTPDATVDDRPHRTVSSDSRESGDRASSSSTVRSAPSGGPAPSSRREGGGGTSETSAGGAAPGSTLVAIPSEQPQSGVAPESGDTVQADETDIEEEIPIEEEDIPEPLSEPASEEEEEEEEEAAEEPRREEPPDSTPVVQLIPAATELFVGDHLAVVVLISGASDVGHVPFHLLFNSQVLNFEYGEEGLFLGSDGGQTAFFAAAASGGGSVVVGLSRLGRSEGVSGSGELCVLHFTAVGPGSTTLTFSREKVKDGSNQILPALFVPVSINVHGMVPEE